ncbi:MAG: c-type cytochrome [Pseudomonadota bacterium]|nr:MAG: c-type cytochrome [Pseudomonadota bacterium]
MTVLHTLVAITALSLAASAAVHADGKKAAEPHAHGHWMAPMDEQKRPNPVKADHISLERGKKLFEENCVSCHGTGGRGDGPAGKALKPRPADLVQMRSHHPDGDFAWKIAEGKAPMPGFKATLNESQIWDLVNYVKRGLPAQKK